MLTIAVDTPEVTLTASPDRMIMFVPGLRPGPARTAANLAVSEARRAGPKSTGASMQRLQPIYGKGYFGIRWMDSYVFFQERGIRPFTMKSLAGKTIPMWIKDPTGTVRAKNPKAKTRVRKDGVTEVKIFRKAATIGARQTKYKRDKKSGEMIVVSDKPASYPGAPGRIGVRESGRPNTTPGKVAGAIAGGNVGVKWRHPGTQPRQFLNHGLTLGAQRIGVIPVRLYVADAQWRNFVHGATFEEAS